MARLASQNNKISIEMVRSENLRTIPGIGPKISKLFNDIGISKVGDLKNKDPERLYRKLEKTKGIHIDRCVLYTFRSRMLPGLPEKNKPQVDCYRKK
jgi:nucleotidyltransferase/DNA polymerase involved in DNA repair